MSKLKITFAILKDVMRSAPGSLIVTAVMYLIMALVPSAQVILTARLFDAINAANWQDAKFTALWFLVSILVYSGAEFVYSIAMNAGLYEKTNAYFKVKLYTKMARLPFIALEDPAVLATKERAEKAISSEVLPSVLHKLLTLTQAIVTMVSVSAVLAGYSLWLLIFPAASVVPYLIIRLIRGKEFYNMQYFQSDKRRLQEYLVSLFRTPASVREMRALGFGEYLADKFVQVRTDVDREAKAFEARERRSVLLCDIIKVLGYGASAVLALVLLGIEVLTVGAFGAALRTISQMQNSLLDVFTELGKLPRQYAIAADYYALFEIPDMPTGATPPKFSDEIRLENISFTYPGSHRPALENVNLSIKKGRTIALVGANGSGKTTLSRVLMGMYPACSGRLTYDGEEVTSAYELFSAVAQDFVKYQDTVEGNIAIARAGEKAEIPEFLAAHGLEGTVESLGGLEQMLGTEFEGRELSGGQWQQLAIARGLYKDSELLILDEPTAALDPITEYEVLNRFLEISAGRTSVIVSHRIGLCTRVDQIIVMASGRVAEVGTHEELMSKQGLYHEMFTAQQQWY